MPKDLFSQQAADYAKWRPTYPPELIQYIISFVQQREIAWDCATGNGQAAILLAEHFEQVFATDLSNEQLKHAKQHSKIIYSQRVAEHTGFTGNMFDLVTVAQAYHWFNHQAFCAEVRRVCKPGAIIAIWGYNVCRTSKAVINKLINSFYTDITGPYWDDARRYVDEEYKTVHFDFEEIPVQEDFFIRTAWTIHDLAGYLGSWSAVQQYIRVNGHDPVALFIAELSTLWQKGETLPFEFPVFMRLGRVF